MSEDIQKAWFSELFKICQIYRSNAALRQGIPETQSLTRIDESELSAVQPAAASEALSTEPPVSSVSASEAPSLLRMLITAVLFALGGGGAAIVAMAMLSPHPPIDPATPLDPPAVERSMLQFLEDEGHHIYGRDREDNP